MACFPQHFLFDTANTIVENYIKRVSNTQVKTTTYIRIETNTVVYNYYSTLKSGNNLFAQFDGEWLNMHTANKNDKSIITARVRFAYDKVTQTNKQGWELMTSDKPYSPEELAQKPGDPFTVVIEPRTHPIVASIQQHPSAYLYMREIAKKQKLWRQKLETAKYDCRTAAIITYLISLKPADIYTNYIKNTIPRHAINARHKFNSGHYNYEIFKDLPIQDLIAAIRV